MDDEELENTCELMFNVLKENFCKILRGTIILFLALPLIKWIFLSIRYMVSPTSEVLSSFAETTFLDNILPWYLDFLINPLKNIALFILLFLLVWIIYCFKE